MLLLLFLLLQFGAQHVKIDLLPCCPAKMAKTFTLTCSKGSLRGHKPLPYGIVIIIPLSLPLCVNVVVIA
jgi:hypothetical protein